MKKKFSKFLGVGLALVLVVSFSLIPAAVMGQTSTYGGYQFSSGTVTWDTSVKDTGSYSVKLDETGTSYPYVEFIPAPGTTMSDLNASVIKEWSFRYHMITQTTGGPNMELRFTSPTFDADTGAEGNAFWGHADVNTQVPSGLTPGVWATEDAVTNPQVQTYFNDPVDGDPGAFDASPFYLLSDTLAAIDADAVMTAHGSSAADWELTRVRIELWDSTDRVCYIDDVTIDGATYAMEPMALDAEYYSIGETVDVTLCNGTLDLDSMAIDTVDIKVVSVTDTLGDTVTLTETGSATGVFTGPVTLLGVPPADREADEIVVSAEDTVTVTYTDGDWGAGTQTIALTASVDDTAPVIVIVSPTVSQNITDATPLIQADYSDAGSDIDTTSVVITVDAEDVTTSATVGGSSVTYTPSEALDEGSHAVTVDVSDLAGNAATQASWSFTVDTVAPVITDGAATPPTIMPDEETEVTFSANVTDATSGVASVTIDLSDTEIGGSATEAMLNDGVAPDVTADDGIYTVAANITASAGSYPLDITAKDNAGNEEVLTAAITLGVSEDIIPPVIADPAITYEYGTSARPGDKVTISANVTDDIGMGTVSATCDAFTLDVDMVDDGTGVDETPNDDIYTGEGTINDPQAQDDYTVTITAKDAKLNEATDETLTLKVRFAATGVEIVLYEGWNLISLPLIPDDLDIAVVISTDTLASGNVSSVGIIRAYDPATGLFPYYMPETGSGDLTEMSDGNGYWVFMETADTLTVCGKQWPVPPAVPPSYDVVVGWNLIGFKSLVNMIDNDPTTDEGYLLNIEGTYPVLWSYDAVSGAYENVKGLDPPNGMDVGHGFWIWITEAGTIVPPG